MNVVFRVDASLEMGTGHVMRCLTLADAFAQRRAECHFLCREHPGHLVELIRSKGFIVHLLPSELPSSGGREGLVHAAWLGATQKQDIRACQPILQTLHPDLLVVDHYALDSRWEVALKPHYDKLMVIDDLADRPHECNLLLDQTFGRDTEDYRAWVPANCQLLCGSQYALLRPEFVELRPYSLDRRVSPRLRQLLISMGGVDKDNAAGQVLEALSTSSLPADSQITVIMGSNAPWLAEVKRQAEDMPWPTKVQVGVSNMAQLMADSDLAIGAAGATSWERCCLGLPTIMLVLAANQQQVARGLGKAGAARIIEQAQCINECLPSLLEPLIADSTLLLAMSQSALHIVDGHGVDTVIKLLEA